MRKFLSQILLFALFSVYNYAQISINSVTFSYTQNFNSLSSVDNSTGNVWSDNSTITGWYSNQTEYRGDDGATTAGSLYSWGTASDPDRALGSLASSGNTYLYAVRFVNNSGTTITSIPLTYTGEQWRVTTAGAQSLVFSYQINAVDISSGSWTEVAALNFTSPQHSSGSSTAIDGNNVANRQTLSTTLSLTLNDGDEIWFRISDTDDSGSDHGLGIDDFQFNPDSDPLPVELKSFSAEYVNNSVQLNWETATETNNAGFEVQRQNSESGTQNSDWEVLTFIPGHGTTNSQKYYSYVDSDLPNADKVSYRLRQIDNDGTDAYSKTVEVDLGGVTSVEDEMQFEFALEQNYPNPFNPVTTINFTLPNVGTTHELSLQAKLTVYNLLGQEVRTLVNEAKPAGSYQIQFDASDLPSGIYFYSLTYGNHIQTRKLALLK
ncbi:MAG: T9SS type A sorting domain-containing protein [Melioribacteraceae bacterium]|nr:T9SS type A sorting domain-containing protein [Melioribacteraceae bacterium]